MRRWYPGTWLVQSGLINSELFEASKEAPRAKTEDPQSTNSQRTPVLLKSELSPSLSCVHKLRNYQSMIPGCCLKGIEIPSLVESRVDRSLDPKTIWVHRRVKGSSIVQLFDWASCVDSEAGELSQRWRHSYQKLAPIHFLPQPHKHLPPAITRYQFKTLPRHHSVKDQVHLHINCEKRVQSSRNPRQLQSLDHWPELHLNPPDLHLYAPSEARYVFHKPFLLKRRLL